MRWRHDTRTAVASVVVCLMFCLSTVQAEKPKPEDEARALLLLAKAKREREKVTLMLAADGRGCLENPEKAVELSREKGKPVIYWVGMCCEENPAVRSGLTDAINCHLPDWAGNTAPRIILYAPSEGSGGEFVSFAKKDVAAEILPMIRKLAGLPEAMPTAPQVTPK